MNPFFRNRFQEFAFIGIILFAFIAFYIETDIYTPTFPQMVNYFGTDEDTIQLLLSMNFLGLCLSGLFFGPASDAFGRKPILCLGIGVFMLASIGCALTDSLPQMIFFRFLQGIGCGSIVSAGLTLFFDVYPADQSSRLVAVCNGTIGGMMALAPIIGNEIGLQFGWRTNFWLIAVLATISFLSIWICIKETLPRQKRIPFNLASVCKNYLAVLTNFPFMAHTLIWCLAFSMVIVFIANLSLIFVDHLGVPKEVFGAYQAAIMGTYFIGSMSAAFLIKHWGLFATKVMGSLVYVVGVLSLASLCLIQFYDPVYLVVSMSLAALGSALAMTIYFSYSMMFVGDSLKGSAMAFIQSLRLSTTSGLVWIAANQFDGSPRPVALLAFACTFGCGLLYLALYKKKMHIATSSKPLQELL